MTRFKQRLMRKRHRLKTILTQFIDLKIKRKANKLSDRSKAKHVSTKEEESDRYQTSHLQHVDPEDSEITPTDYREKRAEHWEGRGGTEGGMEMNGSVQQLALLGCGVR